MNKYSHRENALLKFIEEHDEELFLSLHQLRLAVKKLWDYQPLIQDFTKHNLDHVDRVVDYLAQLMDCNSDEPLTLEERYVLLAAAYLHDIGMQCDVRKVQLACGLDLARGPAGYTREQQNEIRKKHGDLMAAWMDYAFEEGVQETSIMRAIQTIPEELVSAIRDVARYHSGPDISGCSEKFHTTHGGEQRRLFLALLLRLADELDIGKSRIDIDTVLQFAVDPPNALYWWLHYFTTIYINPQEQTIEFRIALHPVDVEMHGEKIREKVVEQFQRKNEEIVEELHRRGVRILISRRAADPTPNPAYKRLPEEIAVLLGEATFETPIPVPRLSAVERLAHEVHAVLTKAGYGAIRGLKRDDWRTVSATYQTGVGLAPEKIRVDFVEGEITAQDVRRTHRALQQDECSKGYIVSRQRISPLAQQEQQEKYPGIRLFTQGELYGQLFDFKHYAQWLKAECEQRGIVRFYVPTACLETELDETGQYRKYPYRSLGEEIVDQWRLDEGRNHLAILGEFGSGKTWFCYHYAYQQLQRYLNDPASEERFPILIPLREYANAGNMREMVTDLLANQYKMHWTGGYNMLEELNRQGRLLLLLDGFDEMGRLAKPAMGGGSAALSNFQELATLVVPKSKVILTSRTEYFRDIEEIQQILGRGESSNGDLLDPNKFRFEVYTVRSFDDEIVREALVKRFGANFQEEYWHRILKDDDLHDLAGRPVTWEMFADVLPELLTRKTVSLALLYRLWINRLLDQQVGQKRTRMQKWEKLLLLSELAWRMVGDATNLKLLIHYRDISELLTPQLTDILQNSLNQYQMDEELRTQSFLTRTPDGFYQFAHRTLAEYLTAFKYAIELGVIQSEYILDFSPEALQHLKKVRYVGEQAHVDWENLARTFGGHPLAIEVRDLLKEMIAEPGLLQQILKATRGRIYKMVGYIGGNVATLLNLFAWDFQQMNLEGAVLQGANLTGANFSGANLRNAVLRNTILQKVSFQATDLSEAADLRGADLSGANLNLAILDGADMRGANCTEITVEEGREIRSCAFNPQGTLLAYGTWEGVVRVVDPVSLEQVGFYGGRYAHTNSVTCVAIDPGGRFIASGGYDATIKLWDMDERKVVGMFYEPDAHFRCLAFSKGGTYLAAADKGGQLYLLQLYGGSHPSIREIWRERLPSGAVRSLTFHPKETSILLVGRYDGIVQVFDIIKNTRAGRELRAISAHTKWIAGLSFGPDARFLATAGWDRTLKIWDFDSGSLVKTVYESDQSIRCLSFDSTGKWIVIGENNGRIQIVDVETGEARPVENRGHEDTVYTIAFRPSVPEQFASVALDASVKMWNVKTGKLLGQTVGKAERFHCSGTKIGGAEMTVDEKDYLLGRGALDE